MTWYSLVTPPPGAAICRHYLPHRAGRTRLRPTRVPMPLAAIGTGRRHSQRCFASAYRSALPIPGVSVAWYSSGTPPPGVAIWRHSLPYTRPNRASAYQSPDAPCGDRDRPPPLPEMLRISTSLKIVVHVHIVDRKRLQHFPVGRIGALLQPSRGTPVIPRRLIYQTMMHGIFMDIS